MSEHAVDRYLERVKPALDLAAASEDLVRMAQSCGEIVEDYPDWVFNLRELVGDDYFDSELEHRHVAVLMLGDDIALPLVERRNDLLAVTCLSRAGLPEGARAYRNRKNRSKRARRATLRSAQRDRGEQKRAKRLGTERDRYAA